MFYLVVVGRDSPAGVFVVFLGEFFQTCAEGLLHVALLALVAPRRHLLVVVAVGVFPDPSTLALTTHRGQHQQHQTGQHATPTVVAVILGLTSSSSSSNTVTLPR